MISTRKILLSLVLPLFMMLMLSGCGGNDGWRFRYKSNAEFTMNGVSYGNSDFAIVTTSVRIKKGDRLELKYKSGEKKTLVCKADPTNPDYYITLEVQESSGNAFADQRKSFGDAADVDLDDSAFIKIE